MNNCSVAAMKVAPMAMPTCQGWRNVMRLMRRSVPTRGPNGLPQYGDVNRRAFARSRSFR